MKNKVQPTLTLLVALQVISIVGQWTGSGGIASPSVARAQIPDSGAQLNEIINELKLINTNLDKIGTHLSGGKLQVQVVNSDEKKGS